MLEWGQMLDSVPINYHVNRAVDYRKQAPCRSDVTRGYTICKFFLDPKEQR